VHALNEEPQAVPLKTLASRNLSHQCVSRNSAEKKTASQKFSRNAGNAVSVRQPNSDAQS